MAITLDATLSIYNASTTSKTVSYTVANQTGRILLVWVRWSNSVSGVTATYNGASMTVAAWVSQYTGTDQFALLTLPNPDTGTHDLVINWTTSSDIRAVAVNYYGTSSYPTVSTGVSELTSIVTGETMEADYGDVILGGVCYDVYRNVTDYNTYTQSTVETQEQSSTQIYVKVSQQAGADQVNMKWRSGATSVVNHISCRLQPENYSYATHPRFVLETTDELSSPSPTTTQTHSIDLSSVSGSNFVLVAAVNTSDWRESISWMRWQNQPMYKLAGNTYENAARDHYTEIWYLPNPSMVNGNIYYRSTFNSTYVRTTFMLFKDASQAENPFRTFESVQYTTFPVTSTLADAGAYDTIIQSSHTGSGEELYPSQQGQILVDERSNYGTFVSYRNAQEGNTSTISRSATTATQNTMVTAALMPAGAGQVLRNRPTIAYYNHGSSSSSPGTINEYLSGFNGAKNTLLLIAIGNGTASAVSWNSDAMTSIVASGNAGGSTAINEFFALKDPDLVDSSFSITHDVAVYCHWILLHGVEKMDYVLDTQGNSGTLDSGDTDVITMASSLDAEAAVYLAIINNYRSGETTTGSSYYDATQCGYQANHGTTRQTRYFQRTPEDSNLIPDPVTMAIRHNDGGDGTRMDSWGQVAVALLGYLFIPASGSVIWW